MKVTGLLDPVGFVLDFAELNWIEETIAHDLDHRHLNDAMPVNPTSENIAILLVQRVREWSAQHPSSERLIKCAVAVHESPRTHAEIEMTI